MGNRKAALLLLLISTTTSTTWISSTNGTANDRRPLGVGDQEQQLAQRTNPFSLHSPQRTTRSSSSTNTLRPPPQPVQGTNRTPPQASQTKAGSCPAAPSRRRRSWPVSLSCRTSSAPPTRRPPMNSCGSAKARARAASSAWSSRRSAASMDTSLSSTATRKPRRMARTAVQSANVRRTPRSDVVYSTTACGRCARGSSASCCLRHLAADAAGRCPWWWWYVSDRVSWNGFLPLPAVTPPQSSISRAGAAAPAARAAAGEGEARFFGYGGYREAKKGGKEEEEEASCASNRREKRNSSGRWGHESRTLYVFLWWWRF